MIINNLFRDNIKRLKPYVSARDEFKTTASSEMIFLDANENPFESSVNRYPDPQQIELKGVLSAIKAIPTKNMLLGNGSDEVLDLIFRAFCEPNKDNVVILPPTYGMYEVLANINAADILKVQLLGNFQPDIERVLDVSNENSKILFLCSPNNPTANSLEISKIELLIKSFVGIVVIDEAYIDFSDEESWLSRLNEFDNLIVTQTFSKAFGMAGIRLGVCYASEEIINVLNRIKPPYNINQLTQQYAIKALKDRKQIESSIKRIKKERMFLMSKLDLVDFISKIYPSDANFILIKVDDALKRYHQLLEKGIVVRNRTNEPLCDNCLRVTIGSREENLKLINILKTI